MNNFDILTCATGFTIMWAAIIVLLLRIQRILSNIDAACEWGVIEAREARREAREKRKLLEQLLAKRQRTDEWLENLCDREKGRRRRAD